MCAGEKSSRSGENVEGPARAKPQKPDECPSAEALGINWHFIEILLILEAGSGLSSLRLLSPPRLDLPNTVAPAAPNSHINAEKPTLWFLCVAFLLQRIVFLSNTAKVPRLCVPVILPLHLVMDLNNLFILGFLH